MSAELAVVVHQCESHVVVADRVVRCRWHEGHDGSGRDVFALHVGRIGRERVLVTWTDEDLGSDFTADVLRASGGSNAAGA